MTWRVVLDYRVGRSGLQGGTFRVTGRDVRDDRVGRSGLHGGTFGMTGSIVKDDSVTAVRVTDSEALPRQRG